MIRCGELVVVTIEADDVHWPQTRTEGLCWLNTHSRERFIITAGPEVDTTSQSGPTEQHVSVIAAL